ncbi:lipid-A-disaccharide synthase [Candidatus Pelagibacter sp.]|nr:lipid-A-disaccharide synthase [Candidatus Pelagibacter sp.]
MKKIFILTGEPSGDKLASTVILKLKKTNPHIEYSCVGGYHLYSLGIKSIFNLKEITYMGFTSVLLNIFTIKKIINKTVDEIIKFKPDILFSVDSPDFTLRVAEKVKKINNNIKTIHYVAPQVWIWREGRVKSFKKFVDHMLLLFSFEKKYFDKVNLPNTFVGHPLLEDKAKSKVDVSSLLTKDKKIISLFAGSRNSETNILLPIICDFIKLMNRKYNDYNFVFHATDKNKELILNYLKNNSVNNSQVISDEDIKSQILFNSIFAVAKSGTVSLEICNANVPSVIIYKINMINYLIMKLLVKVSYVNIINIINDREIIPELLQGHCNANEIFNSVVYFLNNPDLVKSQLENINKTLIRIKSPTSSSENAVKILSQYL